MEIRLGHILGWMRVAFVICLILSVFVDASRAQEPSVSPLFESSDSATSTQNAPPAIDQASLDWWREAQTELFDGIELSVSQQARVDTILEQAAIERARSRRLRQFVAHGPGDKDSDQKNRALQELHQLRDRLGPDGRLDAMRELLTEEQRELFDRSRRLRSDRLFVEDRNRHQAAQERAQRKLGAGDQQQGNELPRDDQ